MAKVWLSLRECASGDLPTCCVVCGCEDDIEYCEREMEYRPNWPTAFIGLHFIGWPLIGAAIGLLTERYNREVLTKLPYCGDHYDYWEKRDHRQHLGVLIIALGWLLPMLVTFVINNNVRFSRNAITVAVAATVIGVGVHVC